jgi:hypothetical protein
MAPNNRVEITDRDGWRKEFPLEKSLLHIGSDARNDIVLETRRGGGVAPRHLQLITMPGGPGFRAINLSDRDIAVGEMGGRSFAPRSALDVADGDHLRLGDFTLVFRLGAPAAAPPASTPAPAAQVLPASREPVARPTAIPDLEIAGAENTSPHIGLKLSLPRATVEPDQPLDGMITVRNLGDEPGVQFRLEVEGLDPEYYEIGPGPILFPNVEKGVYLRLRHPQGPGLAAGRHRLRIHASAPEAYAGEQVSVSREVEIVPYYRHTLALVAVE